MWREALLLVTACMLATGVRSWDPLYEQTGTVGVSASSSVAGFSPEVETTWADGDVAWEDRSTVPAYQFGAFTPDNFDYWIRTTVNERTASFTVTAPIGYEIVVLAETIGSSAPTLTATDGWGDCPVDDLSGTSSSLAGVYFTYGSTGQHHMKFCASKNATSTSTSIPSSGGSKTLIFLRDHGMLWPIVPQLRSDGSFAYPACTSCSRADCPLANSGASAAWTTVKYDVGCVRCPAGREPCRMSFGSWWVTERSVSTDNIPVACCRVHSTVAGTDWLQQSSFTAAGTVEPTPASETWSDPDYLLDPASTEPFSLIARSLMRTLLKAKSDSGETHFIVTCLTNKRSVCATRTASTSTVTMEMSPYDDLSTSVSSASASTTRVCAVSSNTEFVMLRSRCAGNLHHNWASQSTIGDGYRVLGLAALEACSSTATCAPTFIGNTGTECSTSSQSMDSLKARLQQLHQYHEKYGICNTAAVSL